MRTELMLEVAGLTAGYGRGTVLRDVNLAVSAGTAVGLAGLNGAGKSTLLRALSGTVWHRADRLLLCGRPLPRTAHRRAARGLSHVPEGRRVFKDLTVADNLLYGAVAVDVPMRQARDDLDRVLTLFTPLRALLGRSAGQLSGGEQQMLAIGRGLMARPELIMIDEMTLGLSPRAGAEISAVLADIRAEQETTMLLVDQNVELLHALCDDVHVLCDGTLSSDPGQLTATRSYF